MSRKGDDQFVDLSRRHRIQTRRRFVVEHDLGFADQGPRQRHAPLHAARQFGRSLVDRVFQTDESEAFAHALLDFLFVCSHFVESVRDVFADGQRIEESGFLKHHADSLPDPDHLSLFESVVSSPSMRICPSSGFSRPMTSLRIVDFPEPLAPMMIFVSPRRTLKGNTVRGPDVPVGL